MRLNNPAILITAEIDNSLQNEIVEQGIEVDVIPFIRVETINSKQLQTQIEKVLHKQATVVFTSRNAVEAVSEYLQNKKPAWKIFCIGNATRLSVEKYFKENSVAGVAEDAGSLAEKIIADKNSISEVYFFCGDKRRNELPDLLAQNDIVVHEFEVYTTTILQHKTEKDYAAILFFSPSAVNGFFANNTVNETTVLFAIGNTTANEIKKFTKNEIVISNKPDKKYLIIDVVQYLNLKDSRLRGNDV